jgi:hypothetical protein
MTSIKYTNNKKLQIEFTKKNLVENSWMFLIKKFLEKIDFEHISKNSVSLLNKSKWQKKFSNYELFLQEIYMTLTWKRSITNIKYMKENKMYDFIFDNSLAWKSTLNYFQNSFDIKSSFELSELTVELIKENPQFLFSKNWMIILDSDAVDIETHWKQQWSAWHWYYRQTMYYPDVVTIFDWLLPLIWRLRAWNCHWWNWDTELLHEALTSLEKLDCFNWDKVLFRWDSAFWWEKKFSYAEYNWAKFLVRIASNNVLKEISVQSWINIYSNENEINVIKYKAKSWSKERFVIVNKVKKEWQLFADVQFFCTNLFTEKDFKLSQKRLKHKLFRIIDLYHKRWTSEHIFHDLKDSFQAWQTSNHNFYTNSYRFQVSLISMQIYVLFRELFLNDDKKYRKAYYKTIFNWILSLPWILVKHARKIILKIPEYSSKTFYFVKIIRKLQI